MKLVYWYAQSLDDADCYSIRERTKKAALARKAEDDFNRYGPVVKVTVDYADGFDLLAQATSEGGIWQEAAAAYPD